MMAVVTVASLDGFIAVGAGGQMTRWRSSRLSMSRSSWTIGLMTPKTQAPRSSSGNDLDQSGPCTRGPAAERDA
jgi:hypothetical protein